MRIYWNDIGRSKTPERFVIIDSTVNIKLRHVTEWLRSPDGDWNTTRFVDQQGEVQYGPSSFDRTNTRRDCFASAGKPPHLGPALPEKTLPMPPGSPLSGVLFLWPGRLSLRLKPSSYFQGKF